MAAWWQTLTHLLLYLDMMQLSDARAHAASFAADQVYCVDVSQRKTQAFCADRYLS